MDNARVTENTSSVTVASTQVIGRTVGTMVLELARGRMDGVIEASGVMEWHTAKA